MTPEDEINLFKPKLREIIATMPGDFAAAYHWAQSFSHAFHAELAQAMTSRLNTHLPTRPQSCHEERQELASWCNHVLHSLHLAIRCPETGHPSILFVDTRAQGDGRSRFRLQVSHPDGRVSRSLISKSLPVLELMEEPPRRESGSRWRPTSGGGGSHGR